jgi:PleD family two-component response regulator
VDLDTAIWVCDRLLGTLRSADWRPLAVGLQVTASIGLVRRRGDETLEAAIERADDALYRAKFDGRDRVRFMG